MSPWRLLLIGVSSLSPCRRQKVSGVRLRSVTPAAVFRVQFDGVPEDNLHGGYWSPAKDKLPRKTLCETLTTSVFQNTPSTLIGTPPSPRRWRTLPGKVSSRCSAPSSSSPCTAPSPAWTEPARSTRSDDQLKAHATLNWRLEVRWGWLWFQCPLRHQSSGLKSIIRKLSSKNARSILNDVHKEEKYTIIL